MSDTRARRPPKALTCLQPKALTWVVGRCASCSEPLTPAVDGLLVGCEHAGNRNRSAQEWHQIRLRSLAPEVRDVRFGQEIRRAEAHGAEAPHPAPEVRARPAEPSEVPSGAAALRKAATAAGWASTATYARGWTPGSLRKVETLVVRLSRGNERAVACWETGPDGKAKADGAWLVRPQFRKLGVRELKAHLASSDVPKEAA